MGVVYRAIDEELGVPVALKVLRPDLAGDPSVIERFRSELVLARQVTHRNVVRIHDIGEHEDLRFLTMDYVEGRSLREILERDGPLPLERAASILRQIAEGLGEAHAAGVVHRDLKPANILVDSQDRAFVTDFGVARSLLRDGRTRAGAVVGTPDYLAPEQIAGDPVDSRADLYALGIVFFETLSGQLPFAASSQAELFAQRLSGRPRDLRDLGVESPGWARRIIGRCLERSPARRYADARAFLADLEKRRPRGRLRAPSTRIAALALLGIVMAAAAAILWRERPVKPGSSASGAATASRHAVAVLPFADGTSDPSLAWTGPGLAEMLASRLGESSNLRVLDPLRVRRSLADLRIVSPDYDERTLTQLAGLWGVDRIITGTVRRAGQRIRLEARLWRSDASGVRAEPPRSRESPSADGLFAAAAGLADALRDELGPQRGRSADAAGTKSLAAARAFEEGRGRLVLGDELGAIPPLERAVAADPGYGAALEALAAVYQGLGRQEKALEAARKAASAAPEDTRAGSRARARVALLQGKPGDAERRYAELVARLPLDTESRLDLAASQAAQGHHSDAVETLRKAVELDANDPRAWFLLGRSANIIGDSARAANDYLVRALALQTRLGNEKGKADVLNALGAAHQQLGDNPRALEDYTAAGEARRRLGDERGYATTLRNRAIVSHAIGRAREADADLSAARAIFQRLDNRAGLSDVFNDTGFIREGRGDYRQALEAYQQALRIRRELGDERLLAQSYDNVGYIYFLLGEYDNALVYWRPALDLRRKIGEKGGIVLSEQNLGFLELATGKWDAAMKSFADSLEESREIRFRNAIAISLGNLGVVHHNRGNYRAALASWDEALAVAKEADFRPALAEFTLRQGAALLDLGDYETARGRLDAAQKWIQETENREQEADLESLRGSAQLERGELAAARRSFSRALALAQESHSKVSSLQAAIGASDPRLRPPGEAAAALRGFLKEAEALEHALLTIRATAALARAELARGRPAAAEDMARRAVAKAEAVGWGAGVYRLHALLARTLEARGQTGAAHAAWERSLAALARLQEGLTQPQRAALAALPEVREIGAKGAAPAASRS
jgi:tetratricopeptide (TPR) repeat protein